VHRRTAPLLVAALLVLTAGCASGSDEAAGTAGRKPSTGGTASSPAAIASGEPNPAEPVTVSVAVRDGKVVPEPRRVRVPLGRTVELQVTSDVDDELHVHGFDVEEPLDAGRTTTLTLHADEPGLFEVETHESGLQLVQLEVR
jgi:heme/copper-type cytochrome/quinol oxidase subunit 2